jgi:type II secretory pathway pseudopilin PulG
MNKIKHFFNMVEITLALAVVGIGIAGIMSLFPVAVQSSRDSIADNYAADAADQFIAVISLMAQANWAGYIVADTIIPAGRPSTSLPPSYSSCTDSTGIDNIKKSSSNAGIYKLTQKTSDGTSDGTTDFSAFMRVWKEDLPALTIGGQTTGEDWDTSYTYGTCIYVEISYPTQLPEDMRKTKTYYFELFKR